MANSNPPPAYSGSAQTPDETGSPIFSDADYKPVLTNWFTAKPYGFKWTSKTGISTVMFLPISPSNITITTNFATSVTPTIYGTVEEHSPVRYYDIAIEGTTGIGPKYVQPTGEATNVTPNPGRSAFSVSQKLDLQAGGFFAKTIQAAQNIFNDVTAAFGGANQAVAGIQLDQTGYYAFHNLYRFLLKYKKDASGVDSKGSTRNTTKHPLVFFNYKDNNQYKVVVRSFILRRDKENPMLYFYSISMRGYDLNKADSSEVANNEEVTQLQADLGLDGVIGSTFLSDAKKHASEAREVLSSVANGINQLGR